MVQVDEKNGQDARIGAFGHGFVALDFHSRTVEQPCECIVQHQVLQLRFCPGTPGFGFFRGPKG
ncbi:MAG: hypothetical protein NVSMB43_14790 [Pseudarthrobacter sp.]